MTPEEERNEVYQAVGFAICQWNHVEHAIFEIFCRFIQCKSWLAASAAFHTATSFSTRLEMTNYAAQVSLNNRKLKLEWKRLMNRASHKNRTRNNLVHFVVVTDATGKKKPGRRVELIPGIVNVPATIKAKGSRFHVNEIKGAASAFGRLASDLIVFQRKL